MKECLIFRVQTFKQNFLKGIGTSLESSRDKTVRAPASQFQRDYRANKSLTVRTSDNENINNDPVQFAINPL